MQSLKPIETVYKGYRFRSRLEARWAVLFDALEIQWEYEKEGYDLGPAGWYLPDFWLPDLRMWAEVKAEAFNQVEQSKAEALACISWCPVLQLIGTPTYREYRAFMPLEMDEPWTIGYLLDDQCLSEHRFFSSPECGDDPESMGYQMSGRTRQAYLAARGARFEHGETPESRQVPQEPKNPVKHKHLMGRRIYPDVYLCTECGFPAYDYEFE